MQETVRQILAGNLDIVGTMLESNLVGGRQDIPEDPRDLKPGVSITDACLGWEETEALIRNVYKALDDAHPERRRVEAL
jgi:3-deoxy-7-phosphoheptulonate synthase